MEEILRSLLATLALPEFGLSTVFLVSAVSATLVPAGSEWVVLGFLKLNPDLFWTTIAVATAGNTMLTNLAVMPITTVMTAVMLALLSGNMLFAYRDVFGAAEPATKDTEVLI